MDEELEWLIVSPTVWTFRRLVLVISVVIAAISCLAAEPADANPFPRPKSKIKLIRESKRQKEWHAERNKD